MLTQLALLPLLAVTVTGVTSETHDSDVVIDVATSEPVPARAARPMTGTSLLYVFVDGTTPERAVFENGDHPVAARTRARYTKLEIPLDPGVRCREPASVATLDSGLRVQFSCANPPSPQLAPPRRSCWPPRWLCPPGCPSLPRRKLRTTRIKQASLWPKPRRVSKPRRCLPKWPSRRRLPPPQQRLRLPRRLSLSHKKPRRWCQRLRLPRRPSLSHKKPRR